MKSYCNKFFQLVSFLLLTVTITQAQFYRPNSVPGYALQDTTIDSSKVNAAFRKAYNDQTDTLTIMTSDKILFLGDSFLEGVYCALDENAISKVSRFVDFYVDNWAQSGNTVIDLMSHVNGASTVRSFPYTYAQFKPTYTITTVGINDASYISEKQYQFGYEKLIREIRSFGSEPIIASEFFYHQGQAAYIGADANIAIKSGVQYIDNLSFGNHLAFYNPSTNTERGKALDGTNMHPNSWGSWYYAKNVIDFLQDYRPYHALKIWRADSNLINGLTASQARDSLLFWDVFSKLDAFGEIHISQRYGYINSSVGSAGTQSSEYANLSSGTPIQFKSYALVQAKLPIGGINFRRISVDFSLSSGSYNIYVLQNYSTSYDTTWMNTVNYDMQKASSWMLIGTDTSFDLTGIQKYLDEGKLYFLIEDLAGGYFNMTASPRIIYSLRNSREEKSINIFQNASNVLSGELLSNPYFNKSGVNNWTMTGASIKDGDTYALKYPGVSTTYPIRTPLECDDSLMVIGDNSNAYRSVNLSSVPYGKQVQVEIYAQHIDTVLAKNYSYLDVNIHFSSSYPAADYAVMHRTVEVYPLWMPIYLRFRRTVNNDIVNIELKKTNVGDPDIAISKVGVKYGDIMKFNKFSRFKSFDHDSPVYLLSENFEGSGQPTGWSEPQSASMNYDYTTSPLDGTQSLRIDASSASIGTASPSFTASSEVYGFFKYRTEHANPIATQYIVDIRSSAAALLGRLYISSDKLKWYDGISGSVSGTFTINQNTDYYIWWHWKSVSAGSSVLEVWISSTGTKPSTPDISWVAVNTVGDAGDIRFYVNVGSGNIGVYDKVLISSTPIGNQ